jgi:hypothetical protein
MIDLLVPHSRDVWYLSFTGHAARLGEVLDEQPALANAQRDGYSPLWWLPHDESAALDVVNTLLAHGADPSVVRQGRTAADWALTMAMPRVAERVATWRTPARPPGS